MMRMEPGTIRALREHMGLTQTEFGQRLGGIDAATVSRWERGRQRPRGTQTRALERLYRETPGGRLAMLRMFAREGERSQRERTVERVLRNPDRKGYAQPTPMTAAQIAERTGFTVGAVTDALDAIKDRDRVEVMADGSYQYIPITADLR